jgi:hypothetical protein
VLEAFFLSFAFCVPLALLVEHLAATAMWPWVFRHGILAVHDEKPWDRDVLLSPGHIQSTSGAFVRVLPGNRCIFLEHSPTGRRYPRLRGTLLWSDGQLRVSGRRPVLVGALVLALPFVCATPYMLEGNARGLIGVTMVAAVSVAVLRLVLSGVSPSERRAFFALADDVEQAVLESRMQPPNNGLELTTAR